MFRNALWARYAGGAFFGIRQKRQKWLDAIPQMVLKVVKPLENGERRGRFQLSCVLRMFDFFLICHLLPLRLQYAY